MLPFIRNFIFQKLNDEVESIIEAKNNEYDEIIFLNFRYDIPISLKNYPNIKKVYICNDEFIQRHPRYIQLFLKISLL